MEELKIISEKIWDKIKRDKAEMRVKRAELHPDVLTFIYENPELHYIIGLDKAQQKPKRPKTPGRPKVNRRER